MKIAIMGDSRSSYCPGAILWTGYVVQQNPKHKFFFSQDKRTYFTSIINHYKEVIEESKKGLFDIAILQLGYHESYPWPESFWSFFEDVDPDWKKHITRVPDFKAGEHTFQNCYRYSSDDVVKKCLTELRKVCKKLIFISMHYTYEELKEGILKSNTLYSSLCDLTITIPLDPEWTEKNCFDHVHYTAAYQPELAKLVAANLYL